MNIDSPFEQWRLMYMQGMAVSPEIMTMLALAFEGGRVAQPEQEPVAWMVRDQVDGCRYPSALKNPAGSIKGESQPLFTAPPNKPWVGLHLDDIPETYVGDKSFLNIARWAEAKLKEKNGG